MSYESHAEPIKLGYLFDFKLPPGYPHKAVIGAYAELVDEGCLAVFGPAITDNAVPVREEIDTAQTTRRK